MSRGARTPHLLAALGLLFLVGLNLRMSIAGFSPLIPLVRADTDLSGAGLGLITGTAVVMFGILAPVTPRLVGRFGPDTVLTMGLTAICAGVGLRLVSVLAGMAVIGAGIGLMNVVLPVMVKRDHPSRMALATAVYTSALNVGSASVAAGMVPLSTALGGWQLAALTTAAPAALALAAWQLRPRRAPQVWMRPATRGTGLWRSRVAWLVTTYMALQSLLYYVVLAWLPTIYADAGMSPTRAGVVLAVAQVGQLVGCIGTPALLRATMDQRLAAAGFATLTLVAFVGFTTAPMASPLLYAGLLGIGQGGALVVALLLIGVRSPDMPTAARLSGMSQGVGYLVAAAGPPLVGMGFDRTGSWRGPLTIMCGLCVTEVVVGLRAGRNRVVPSTQPRRSSAVPPVSSMFEELP